VGSTAYEIRCTRAIRVVASSGPNGVANDSFWATVHHGVAATTSTRRILPAMPRARVYGGLRSRLHPPIARV
jgi:hypothetical protein